MTDTAHTTGDAEDDSTQAHGRNRYDDIPVTSVLYYGGISVVCTLLAFLFVKGLLNAMTASFEAKRQAEIVETPANREIAKQQKLLEGTENSISIEQASKKMLEKYRTE